MSLIDWSRFEVVVWPDRDIEMLHVVPVEIPEDHREATVVVLLPAFEDRLEVLTASVGLRVRARVRAEQTSRYRQGT